MSELTRNCTACQQPFLIDVEHLQFLESLSPEFLGKRELIAPPKLCPLCRLQRRLAFRNPVNVGWRKCEHTGRKVLSAFPMADRAHVIDNDVWWSDCWSAYDYGFAYDPKKSFLAQFQELRFRVPYAARLLTRAHNSEYCSNTNDLKDCYFVFNTHDAEDSMYCDFIWGSRSCLDCTRTIDSELCYNCLECFRCYNLQDSEFCHDCHESFFLSRCRACSECFACVNLTRKKYYIFNKQHTEAEYRRFVTGLKLHSFSLRQELRKKWVDMAKNYPHPHIDANRIEDCSGNYLVDCSKVHDSFFVTGGEDLRWCFVVHNDVKNCRDYSHFGNKMQNLYECQTVGHGGFQLLFCLDCWDGNNDLLYCASCFGCHDCFGCVGLRKAKFCVLNVQYSPDEYQQLVCTIIKKMRDDGEWGEFFPMTMSAFPYNLSFAHRYFPLTEAEARKRNLLWYERDEVEAQGALPASHLADELPNEDQALTVISTGNARPFRITSAEINRYRLLKVPLPRRGYAERMEGRWARLGGVKLSKRQSAVSGNTLLTSMDSTLAPVIWSQQEWEKEVW